MHPAYGYHQPFPLPRDQNPYIYYHYPSWEAVPPHMKSDVSSRPPSVGPWASNSSFGHSIPADHNHCCSHSYPPGYYSLRPPYSPIQPPPQPYYYGPYPPYPDFSRSYFVPPPHYSVDQSRYDYDKVKEHCCGCPNHVCQPKEARGTSLRIEEQKPEEEEEQKEGRLIRPQNSPRSFFWIPHDSNKRKPSDDKSELHPSQWNGWIPLDLNNLKGMMQGGGNEKTSEEFPPKFKIIPLKFLENGSLEDKPGVVGDAQPENQSCNGTKAKAKAIPVLLHNGDNNGQKPGGVAEAGTKEDQVHSIGELEKETNAKAKTKTIPVKQMEEANATKPVLPEKEMGQSKLEENEEKKASGIKAVSVKKPSKLPPVCLRVDPLPKKKAGNGSARSSSLSGRKEERAHQEKTEQKPKDMKAIEQKKDVKVIKVFDAASDSSSKPEAVPVVPLKNAAGRDGAEIAGKDEDKKGDGENKNSGGVAQEEPSEGKMTTLENKVREKGKESRRNLSQSEAAVLIQSAYRGFEVRRWQPLEKLRKIGRIREQAADIERQIESLQASSKELDSKQRVVIGEAIMNLLLQLDTIQGLHTTIRETRKAVARYLICLQEKLDSLGSQATTDEPSQTEQDSTKKSPIDESAKSLSSTLETEQIPEKESAQPLEQDGLTKESSFGLDRGTEYDDKKHEEAELGNGEALETPAKSLEPLPPAFSDYEEQKEARLVNDENMESSCTTEESAQSTGGENMTSIDVVHNLAVQELPVLQELNCQESQAVESICDAAMKDEGMTMSMKEISDPAVKDEKSDATTVFNQKDERLGVGEDAEWGAMEGEDELSVPTLQLISKAGGVVEDAEKAATEGEISDATIEYESNAGVDQRKSLEISLEDPNKLREEDVVAKADGTDPGFKVEVSAALSEEEDKPDVKEQPLLFMEKDDHVNETTAFSGADNSRSLEVLHPEQMQCNVAATVGNDHPRQMVVENVSSGVIESSEEDGHEDAANESIEYIDAGAAVESAAEEAESPISNGVSEPSKVVTAFEADSSELIGEDASSAAHNVKTGSEGVSTLELSSKAKQLAEENEKLRKMLENLLEAGKHQLGVISELNGRVTELEKRLTKKKKVRVGRNKAGSASPCTENEDRISRKKLGSSAARIKC